MTLADLELTLKCHYALLLPYSHVLGANNKNLNEDRPFLSAAKCSLVILHSFWQYKAYAVILGGGGFLEGAPLKKTKAFIIIALQDSAAANLRNRSDMNSGLKWCNLLSNNSGRTSSGKHVEHV